MTENKKPIILVVDDFADENFVTNNIKKLASNLNFDGDEVAKQVKVITDADKALEFIERAKLEKQPIAMAFIDNSMDRKPYGLRFATDIKKADADTIVVWISSESISEVQKKHLQEEGFSPDDKLMFNDGKLSGPLKSFLLNEDLSTFIKMNKYPIHEFAIPAIKKVFEKIAP